MIRYTDLDGLASTTIYDIEQDNKGYLWVGTANGLCRYNGKSFQKFEDENMRGREVLEIDVDVKGRVWHSTFFGYLYYVEDEEVHEFKMPKAPSASKVMSILADSEGFVWVGTMDNIYKFREDDDSGTFEIADEIPSTSTAHSHNIVEDKNGTVWAVRYQPVRNGLNLINASEKKFIPLNRPGQREIVTLSGLNSGKLVLLCRQPNADASFINDGKESPILEEYSHLFIKGIVCVFEDRNGWLWVGTTNGVYYFDQDLKILNEGRPFLEGISVNDVTQDREGNYWFGTDGEGLFFLPNLGVMSYTTENSPLENNRIFSLETSPKGEVFFGMANGSISKYYDGQFSRITIPQAARITFLLYKEETGMLYAGTDKDIYNVRNGNIIPLGLSNAIKNISLTRSGSLLVAAGSEALLYDPIGAKESNLLGERTYSIFEDNSGITWIGGISGLWKLQDGKAQLYKTNNGSSLQYRITSFVEDDSSIWISTFGNGLVKIQNGETSYFTEADGLSSNICTALYKDQDSILWVGTDRGLNKFNISTHTIEKIDILDGLVSNEINFIDKAGDRLYVATPKGANSFHHSDNFSDTLRPNIFLTGLRISGQDTTLHKNYLLNPSQNEILVEYTGISYKSQDKLMYRYKMSGLDSTWVSSKADFVHFRALKPGIYNFQVKALNADGFESSIPASVSFEIEKPFLQTLWFKLLMVLGMILMIGLAVYFTIRRLNKKRRFENEINEKIDELRMQALQSQMNPHFVFNALNAILHLLSVNDKKSAMNYLAMFARLIRLIFEHSKKKTIPLNSEIEFLKLYLELEKLRFEEKIDIHFEIDENLRTHQIRIPPLLIQPIIENSFKHGLLHKENGGKLSIHFKQKDKYLICTVEDNGIGREEAMRIGSWKPKGYRSSGLKTTKERLTLLNKSMSKNGSSVSLEIKDIVGNNGEAAGTKVDLRIEIES